MASKPHFRPLAAEQSLDLSARVCPMQYETSELLHARMQARQIGDISLVHYESRGLEHGTRTIEHIRENHFDFFILCLPLHARFRFIHAGLESDFAEGEAIILTAQRPFDAYISGSSAADAWHSSLEVRIPGPLLRGRAPRADLYCNRAFSIDSAPGTALKALLLSMLDEAAIISRTQAIHVCRALTELLAGCLAELDEKKTAASETSRTADVLFKRATSYIESRLSAIDLDAEIIARHCHISASYLHKIFARHSLTVAGYIREMRLHCCQEAIRNPRMADRSIFEIACRWGFTDPSHFGRLYRKRFGISPKEERAAHALTLRD